MTEPTRFFFVHLQKTAGTTLDELLRRQFGGRAVYPLREDQDQAWKYMDVAFLQERFAEIGDSIRVVTGHFPLCTAELLGVPFTTFTILRDPVERTLSFLRHHRQLEPRFRESSLEDIYAEPLLLHGMIHNHMVKMLSLTVDEMTDGVLTWADFDESRLERAQENLAERVDAVGLQEHFDLFCRRLDERYGWQLPPPAHTNRTEPMAVSEEFRARIAYDNRLDVELYRYAERLCAERGLAPAEA